MFAKGGRLRPRSRTGMDAVGSGLVLLPPQREVVLDVRRDLDDGLYVGGVGGEGSREPPALLPRQHLLVIGTAPGHLHDGEILVVTVAHGPQVAVRAEDDDAVDRRPRSPRRPWRPPDRLPGVSVAPR